MGNTIYNTHENDGAIGIFDSGVGGLTVVREVIKALPHEDIIYFGDTARVPYGSKSKETVTKFSGQIMRFLLSKNVKAVIIACNTVSSNSYQELSDIFHIPIIEVVTPGVEACLSDPTRKTIGVIGTEATINSKAYERRIHELVPDAKVYSKACPLFVPLAEEGWTNNHVTYAAADIYLRELISLGIDSLILGCTHYPLLIDCIKEITGNINIINPAEAVAKKTMDLLTSHKLLSVKYTSSYKFYASDDTRKFTEICTLVLGNAYKAEKIDIEKY